MSIKSKYLTIKKIALIALCLFAIDCSISFGQSLRYEWQVDLGCNNDDYFSDLEKTPDGGSIVLGTSFGGNTGNKTVYYGDGDYWLAKLDSTGQLQWQKTYGSDSYEVAASVTTTTDGGYIICGFSASDWGGNKTATLYGYYDYWVLKLNAAGYIEWQKSFGTTDGDFAIDLVQTNDGGFIIGGTSDTQTSSNKLFAGYGLKDYWIVKLDSNGTKLWDKCYGGADYDVLTCLIKSDNGNLLLGGYSKSYIGGNKTEHAKGLNDYWIIKIDSIGNIIWQNTIGGSQEDFLFSAFRTSDNGFVLGGNSNSSITTDKTENKIGLQDFWIVKVDSMGNVQWQNTIGGTKDEKIGDVIQTSNGEYVVAGKTVSETGGDRQSINYGSDIWLLFLDTVGIIVDQKIICANKDDGESYICCYQELPNCKLVESNDGGLFLGTSTRSGISLEKNAALTVYGNYYIDFSDYWIIKLNKNYNLANGKCYLDVNKNNVFDGNDKSINGFAVNNNGSQVVFTDNDGNYELTYFDPGTYTYKPPLKYNGISPTPAKHIVSFTNTSTIDSLNNFSYKPPATLQDLEISLTPALLSYYPDTEYFRIEYQNNGTSGQLPIIVFYTDTNFVFISASIASDSITPDSVIWNLPLLPPNSSGHFYIKVYKKTKSYDNPFITKVVILPIIGDDIDTNNIDIWNAMNSNYDQGFRCTQSATKYYLRYLGDKFTTDFTYSYFKQKIDTCNQIMFEVIIPTYLSFSTFKLVSSSHPVTMSFDKHSRMLKFITQDLELIGSSNVSDSNTFVVHFEITNDTIYPDKMANFQGTCFVDSVFQGVTNNSIEYRDYCNSLSFIHFNDNKVCETDTVMVSNDSEIPFSNNFVWLLDSDTISTDEYFTFSQLDTGKHSITLIVTSPYCQQTQTVNFHVNSFDKPIIAYANQYTYVNHNSGSFQWYLNDSIIPGANNGSYNITQTGWYKVFADGLNGCKAFSDSLFLINCKQAAIMQLSDSTPCPRTPVIATNIGHFKENLIWYLNGNVIAGDSIAYVSGLEPGNNYFNIYLDSANCKGYYFQGLVCKVKNFIIPYLSFNGDTIHCDKTFSYYEWFFNGVSIPNNHVQNLHPDSSGYYQLFVIDSLGCAHFTDSIYYDNALGVIQMQLDTIMCVGDAFFATNKGNYPYSNNFQWFVDSVFQVADSSLFLGNIPVGNHLISLQVIINNDTIVLSKLLIVYDVPPKPIITLNNNQLMCNDYGEWFRNGVSLFYKSYNFGVNQAGWYQIKVYNNSGCFTFSDSMLVIPCSAYNQVNVLNNVVCNSDTLTAFNSSIYPSLNYWSVDGNFISNDTIIHVAGLVQGNHTITLTTTSPGCVFTSNTTAFIFQQTKPTIIENNNTLKCDINNAIYQWFFNGAAITNAKQKTYTVTQQGWYQVQTINTNNCWGMSDSVFCIVCNVNVDFILSDDSVCSKDTIIAYMTNQSNTSVHWLLDGVNYSYDSLIYLSGLSYGYHWLQLVYDTLNCNMEKWQIIYFDFDTLKFTPQNNMLSCTYYVASFQWYLNGSAIPNATNNTYHITQSGNYSLSAYTFNNCLIISDTIYVEYCNFVPSFTMSTDPLCKFDTLVCYMNHSPSPFLSWKLNGVFISTDSIIYLTNFALGNNWLSLEYLIGFCFYKDEKNVQVMVATKPVITVLQNLISTIPVNSASFQWLLNGVNIPNANSSSFVVTQTGYYQVSVLYPNGCSNISDSVYVIVSGIQNNSTNNFMLYPNPANEEINIVVPCTFGENYKIELLEVTGAQIEIIFNGKPTTNELKKKIILKNLSKGVYLIRVNETVKYFIKS